VNFFGIVRMSVATFERATGKNCCKIVYCDHLGSFSSSELTPYAILFKKKLLSAN
jgi:hypothetical protein